MPLIWLTLLGCPTHRYPDGTGLAGQLEREVIALHQRVKQLEAEVASCGSSTAPDPLYAELRQVFSGSEVEVDRDGGRTVLSVRASHVFSDTWALTDRVEAKMTLDLVATALRLHPEVTALVVGHTNDRPLPRQWQKTYRSNLDLSTRMATAFAARLVREFELPEAQLMVAGRGQYAPVESNDIEAGRDANQRLEIWLYPAGEPVTPPR